MFISSYVIQLLSNVRLFVTPWTAALQASLSFTISQSLLKLMSIELVMPSNHLIICHPLLLPSVSPSIRVFSNESALHIKWPNYWSFSISPSNEYSGYISLGLTGLFSLLSKGLSRVFSSTTFKSINSLVLSLLYGPTLTIPIVSIYLIMIMLRPLGVPGGPGGKDSRCLPVIWKTWVRSLGQEVPLEKEMVTHSSILTWKIPWMDGPGML